jgi:hypothetical protein
MGCDEYNVVIRNRSSSDVDRAEVAYGEVISPGGHLSNATGGAKHNLPGVPLPDEATVSWRSGDGVEYTKTIEVLSGLPRGFNKGDLIFVILDGGEVRLEYETWAEQDAREADELRLNPPVFAEGELEIVSGSAQFNSRTKGLMKLGHLELEVSAEMRSRINTLWDLADSVKRDGARYAPGMETEVRGQRVCFREGGEDWIRVEPCGEPDP